MDRNGRTIDDKGSIEVYDAVGNDSDTKRFCTLNLFGGMMLRGDMANQVKPHLVFSASKFRAGEDWDEEERLQWDPGVIVSFQENAWVDAQTHKYGLEKILRPVNDHLEEVGMKGLVIEDNLSSHKTDDVFKFWEEELRNFLPPKFVPASMTETIQVIDRHIGILYKRAVYRAMRTELHKRLSEARAAAGGAEGVTVRKMTPRDKRIIITKAVADCHRKLTASDSYLRAFIATATWMPVSHLMEQDDDNNDVEQPSNAPQDYQVSLQHLSDYNYAQLFCKEKILPEIQKMNKEKEDAIAAEQQRQADMVVAHAEDIRMMQQYVNKAASIMTKFEVRL